MSETEMLARTHLTEPAPVDEQRGFSVLGKFFSKKPGASRVNCTLLSQVSMMFQPLLVFLSGLAHRIME